MTEIFLNDNNDIVTIPVITTPLPLFLSDLVFNYVVCARAYHMKNDDDLINDEEEDLALSILVQTFAAFGLTFTKADLLADIVARS